MAHIVNCRISGLVGKTKEINIIFDRYVNVLFGLNGCGKTSLLKILNSAMDNDSSSLATVPFVSAEVGIYSIDYGIVFTYSITNPEHQQPNETLKLFPDQSNKSEDAIFRLSSRGAEQQKSIFRMPPWQITPSDYKLSRLSHRYLPTSRLYTSDTVFANASRGVPLSTAQLEESVDKLFAGAVQQRWQQCFYEILGKIGRIQEKGIIEIFQAVLAGTKKVTKHNNQIDAKSAYDLLIRFLNRQNAKNIFEDYKSFETRFKKNKTLQNVAQDILRIEEEIALANAPREKLEQLVTEMFTGHKQVSFGQNGISVITDDDRSIELSGLSSGEKHVLMILLETWLAEINCIIIDEPELSLHIDWQKNLIYNMKLLNPRTQIIVATHSPEIMAKIDDERIINLD
jgi:predicted ATP-dependent endonuclease of OLD family